MSKLITGPGKSTDLCCPTGCIKICSLCSSPTRKCSNLTLDIIGHAALSRDFGALHQPLNEVANSFTEILEPSFDRVAYFALGLVLPQWLLTKLPLKTNRVLDHHCRFLRRTCEEILLEKKEALFRSARTSHTQPEKTEADEADIMREIIGSGSFTDTEIVDQMLTVLAAGVSSGSRQIPLMSNAALSCSMKLLPAR